MSTSGISAGGLDQSALIALLQQQQREFAAPRSSRNSAAAQTALSSLQQDLSSITATTPVTSQTSAATPAAQFTSDFASLINAVQGGRHLDRAAVALGAAEQSADDRKRILDECGGGRPVRPAVALPGGQEWRSLGGPDGAHAPAIRRLPGYTDRIVELRRHGGERNGNGAAPPSSPSPRWRGW